MNDESTQPTIDPERRSSPALALCLAFAPTVLLLGLFTLGVRLGNDLLMPACFFCAVCCFVSSFMLFARRDGVAIFAGLVFLLWNGLIAFSLGCAASFHF